MQGKAPGEGCEGALGRPLSPLALRKNRPCVGPSKKFVVLTLGAFAASGAVAFAAWSTNGAGQASAQAGTASAVTLTAAAPSTVLYPGASAAVATTIGNPNPFPVHVSSIALDASQGTGGFSVDAAHSGCDLATTGTFSSATEVLLPGTLGGTTWTLPFAGSRFTSGAGYTIRAVATDAAGNGGQATVTFTYRP
jgi:hypothetical protein